MHPPIDISHKDTRHAGTRDRHYLFPQLLLPRKSKAHFLEASNDIRLTTRRNTGYFFLLTNGKDI